jgi:two-component system LytT family sensor kinase
MTSITLTGDQYILFILFFKMGIMASIAGAVVASMFFKRLLFTQTRTRREDWWFAMLFGALLAAGAAVRVLVGYEGVDISLSGVFLIGLLGGAVPGMAAGTLVSVPAVLGGEWLAFPMLVIAGAAGGWIGRRPERREQIWEFTPYLPRAVSRSMRTLRRERRLDAVALVLLAVLALDVVRTLVGRYVGKGLLFSFAPDHWWMETLVWISTLACVGIPLKIWNNTRVEILLEDQRAAAVQARFDALRRQINPHFLFNTLNTAISCIWSDPNTARWILVKLSTILRKLLQATGDYVPLSRELELIDDYLSLEQARFGSDRIRVEREIDPRALDVPVPSMLLQPIVENSVRHGLSKKLGGGTVRIEAARDGDRMRLVVSDDGLGFDRSPDEGIGLRNVRERLTVAYGTRQSLEIRSAPGEGTRVTIEIPVEREGAHDG